MGAPEQKYVDVQIWLYDVWGNEKDGYEVNDQWKYGDVLTINLTIWNSPELLLKKVLRKYLLKPGIHSTSVVLSFDSDDFSEIEVYGKPIGRIEIVKRYE